jgi:hypothetical protein
MARKPESLRYLVESRAAEYRLPLRTLWGWVLDAIARDMLIPEDISLYTPFDCGGRALTWRQVIVSALRAIERHVPSNDGWANSLMLDPTAFDKWLAEDSPASTPPVQSQTPKRRRPPDYRIRQVVQNYRKSEQKKRYPTSIPRMWEYVKKALPHATRDQAIKVFQALEGGSKGRGRPRKG